LINGGKKGKIGGSGCMQKAVKKKLIAGRN